MAYSAISARRMPFDIDGTEIGWRSESGSNISLATLCGQGIASWLDSTAKGNLNKEDQSQTWTIGFNSSGCFWFFFPEIREITHIGIQNTTSLNPTSISEFIIQGSSDTTNGMDGSWETAVFSAPTPGTGIDAWRSQIFAVSFSGPMKALRIGRRTNSSGGANGSICGLHIYGQKTATEQPDDILFCDTSGNELTALMDFGDQPEGTTEIGSFKIKNASADKIANDINLQLNHDDFAISFSSSGPWTSVLDISSLGAGSLSSTIYVRNALEPPLLTLGPFAARVIASVGSWT